MGSGLPHVDGVPLQKSTGGCMVQRGPTGTSDHWLTSCRRRPDVGKPRQDQVQSLASCANFGTVRELLWQVVAVRGGGSSASCKGRSWGLPGQSGAPHAMG